MPLPVLVGDLGFFVDAIWSAGAALTQGARRPVRARETDAAVAIAVGEDAVTLAAPAWRSIERSGGAATPFQSLAFAQRTAEVHLRRGETPRIIVVHDGGQPAVIFPTVIGRWKGIPTLRFLGDPLIQYGDVVAAPGAAPALLEAAWRAATKSSGAWLIHLRKIRDDARIAPVLARNTYVMAEHEAPFVDVAQPAGTAHDRREVRRCRRRLAELGDLQFEMLRGDAARESIEEALRLKRDWLAVRGLPSSVIGDPDWERAIAGLADDGSVQLRAARLTVDGRTAAIELGFVHGRRWHAFLGAMAPDFAKAGPGRVQMDETFAHCHAEGLESYDLLAPSDAYKQILSHGAVTVRDHALALQGAGWLGLLMSRALPIAKSAFALVPQRVRRAFMARRGSAQPPQAG